MGEGKMKNINIETKHRPYGPNIQTLSLLSVKLCRNAFLIWFVRFIQICPDNTTGAINGGRIEKSPHFGIRI